MILKANFLYFFFEKTYYLAVQQVCVWKTREYKIGKEEKTKYLSNQICSKSLKTIVGFKNGCP